MTKRNSIVSDYLTPFYTLAIVFAAVGGTAVDLLYKRAKLDKELCENGVKCEHDMPTYILGLFAIMASVYIVLHNLIDVPKNANNKALLLARQYLSEFIQNNPTLKKYEPLLDDYDSLQKLSAMICNELSSQEQCQIVQIAKQFRDVSGKSEVEIKNKIKEINSKIIDIVRNRAMSDYIYSKNIEYNLEKIQSTYVMGKTRC